MAPHSSTLAWKIPWTEEPGGLQSMGSLRVRNDWATSLSLFTFMYWRRKWQPTPVFLPGESQGREPGGLPSMGLHRVGHNWSNLAAAAAALRQRSWLWVRRLLSTEDDIWREIQLRVVSQLGRWKEDLWSWKENLGGPPSPDLHICLCTRIYECT